RRNRCDFQPGSWYTHAWPRREKSPAHAASDALQCRGGRSAGPSQPLGAPMDEVTRLLSAIEQGDPHAASQLLPLVYDELRRLAAQKLAGETPGQTLQATALVHEAYLRLAGPDGGRHFNGRAHFFRAAADAMRRALVDRAREKHSQKRGGAWRRVDLDQV